MAWSGGTYPTWVFAEIWSVFASNPSHLWVLTQFDLDLHICVKYCQMCCKTLENHLPPGQRHGNGFLQINFHACNSRNWDWPMSGQIPKTLQKKKIRNSQNGHKGTNPPKRRGFFGSQVACQGCIAIFQCIQCVLDIAKTPAAAEHAEHRHLEGSRRPMERLPSSPRFMV